MVTRLVFFSRYKRIIEFFTILAIVGMLVALFLPPVRSTCGPRRVTVRDLYDVTHYRTQNKNHTDIQEYLAGKSKNRFGIWKETAEEGLPAGQTLIGLCYFYGIDVPEDKKEAVAWLSKAARQGCNPALDFLLEIEEEEKQQLQE